MSKLPGVDIDADLSTFNHNTELATCTSYNPCESLQHPGLDTKGEASTFGALDIAALQLVFGANTSTGLGDKTYGYDRTKVDTVWDNRGNATIDYSSATDNVVIDLRAAMLEPESGGARYFLAHRVRRWHCGRGRLYHRVWR